MKKLKIYYRDNLIGYLWKNEISEFVFEYSKEWLDYDQAFPLSVRLPLHNQIFDGDISRSFFSNLLPEGRLLEIISRNLKISASNTFALLEKLGLDCAGALRIVGEDETFARLPGYIFYRENNFHEIVSALPANPMLAGKSSGTRLSLAGAQNKLPVFISKDGKFGIPEGGAPSSHIIKLPITEHEDTIANEAFCMTLARAMKLNVPDVIIHSGKDRFLIVNRYDRYYEEENLYRIHQEDFCQAMGYLPGEKYEADGGPDIIKCFRLLRDNSTFAVVDMDNLLRWLIFCFLIGNYDNHAKNLSLLITHENIRLAPFYDLLSTKVYPGLTNELAIKIDYESNPDKIEVDHWKNLSSETDIKPAYTMSVLKQMAEEIAPKAEELSRSLIFRNSQSIIEKIIIMIKHIASGVLSQIK
jgi:serine/threonine-protein kinase HipA